MPRKPEGYPERHGDHWDARLGLPGRPRVCLPPSVTSKDAAKAQARALTIYAREHGVVRASTEAAAPAVEAETVRAWAKRWTKAREARGLRSVRDDRGRLEGHVLPVLGDAAMASVTSAQVRGLVAVLDREGEVCWRREWPWSGLERERADLRSLCEGWCSARKCELTVWEEAIELAQLGRRKKSKTRSATWAAKRAGLSPMGPRGAWLPKDIEARPAWLRELLTRHTWSLTEAAREVGCSRGSMRAAAVRYLGAEYEARGDFVDLA